MKKNRRSQLLAMYHAMHHRLGSSHWWPGETPLEIIVGAVLTQNTSWNNVEKALQRLREHRLLEHGSFLLDAPLPLLEECLRPSGFFRIKTERLRAVMRFFESECQFDYAQLTPAAHVDTYQLRQRLLSVKGVGCETADSILLYALEHPIFVVDAYTKRICSRHGLLPDDVWYDELQAYFMDVLEPDTMLFNEYHALLVRVGKEWCRKGTPRCTDCPLGSFCEE